MLRTSPCMDAGLLLAGVSTVVQPPGAPPGKEIETPPAEVQNEFKDVLKQAEGKSSGEVAEAEPNAQPQKLDSKEDATKEPKENSGWSALMAMTASVPQALASALSTAVVKPEATSAPVVHALSESPQVGQVPSFSDESLNSEISKVLNVVSVETTRIDPPTRSVEFPSETLQVNTSSVAPFAIAEAADPSTGSALEEPRSETKATLMSQPGAPTEVPKNAGTSGAETAQVGSSNLKVSVDKTISPAEITKTEKTSAEPEIGTIFVQSTDETESNSSGDAKSDSNFAGQQQQGQPVLKSVSGEPGQKVEQSMAMTPAERKAVVHQLTQKIEALAINSVRNEVTVRMEPAELGTVLVQVSKGISGLTASLCASDQHLQTTLHESKNELAAVLTAKTNSAVRVEVVSADSMPMGTSADSNRQPSPQQQPRQEAVTKFFESKNLESHAMPTQRVRVSTGLIDLES